MPIVNIRGPLVLEKKSFKGFYHICTWQPSWSCDLDHLYKFTSSLPMEGAHEILITFGQAVLVKKMFEIYGHTSVNPILSHTYNATR